jgi:hypothetical protein
MKTCRPSLSIDPVRGGVVLFESHAPPGAQGCEVSEWSGFRSAGFEDKVNAGTEWDSGQFRCDASFRVTTLVSGRVNSYFWLWWFPTLSPEKKRKDGARNW